MTIPLLLILAFNLAFAALIVASVLRCRWCGGWHESAEAEHNCQQHHSPAKQTGNDAGQSGN